VSHTRSNGKELLLGLIHLHAFDFTKGNASRLGNLGHIRSDIFTHQQSQAALGNGAFVVAMRNE